MADVVERSLRTGDVVLVQAGDFVPADLRLVEARGLEVDEWELTGEIAPVAKRVNGSEAVYLYQGSRVVRGNGKGEVTAVGAATEYGAILKQREERHGHKRPAVISGRYLILLIGLLPAFGVALIRYGRPAAFLSVLITAALALLLQNGELLKHALISGEVRRLKARNILLQDEEVLSVLADLDVICLDKTGVLTARDIEVKRIYCGEGMLDLSSFPANDHLATLTGIACALCNDVMFLEKLAQADPIDRALISFAGKHGFDFSELIRRYRRVYDEPFDSEARYMAAGFEHDGRTLYFAKGDPETILRMCDGYFLVSGAERRMDGEFGQSVRAKTQAISQEGDIAISLAYRDSCSGTPPRRYTFLGLIHLENPLRPGAGELIARLNRHGIRAVMMTGDRPETALAVGRKVGLVADSPLCLTGKHIAGMALTDVARQAAYVPIFARLLPSQKGVLIRLLQQQNHVVGMVGDGANDAIALRAADVGISTVADSSPFARRAAQALINELADLTTLIEGARRLQRRVKFLTAGRWVALAAIALGWYVWGLVHW